MEKWKDLARRLKELINPPTLVVGVKFLKDEGEIPSKARRPLRDLGVKMAPCQGVAMARRYGWTVGFAKEDVGCAIASHTYGWDRLKESQGAINFLIKMNYAADERAAKEIFTNFRLLDLGYPPVVLYFPLERAVFKPDVVLIYVDPAQMMRLIHGATYHSGRPLRGSFSGRAASCTEGVIGAYMDRDSKVVVPGNGDRVWASCQDFEMIMAIYGERLEEVIVGLEKTHKKGIRYPIPTYLRYQPEVGFTIPLSDIFKPGEIEKFTK